MSFVPKTFQTALDLNKIIINKSPQGEDVVPLDVVFVGAGPAGLSGAIELARLVKNDPDLKDIQIGVLEKGPSLGSHNLSGAVVNPMGFRELFPELKDSDFPFRRAVEGEKVYLLTPTNSFRLPKPPPMDNHGNYISSLCEMVRWLGEKAEGLGVNIFSNFPADGLFVEGQSVVGVKTTAQGLKRDRSPGSQYAPPTEISARVTVLSEGCRGPMTQGYLKWQNIKSHFPQIYALGVKEIWKVKKVPNTIYHTLGWPLPKTAFGGSWMYPLADDLISLGLVVGLDYKDSNLDVHGLLQKMKQHPLFQNLLKDGEVVEWGAKTIPEGGYHALPDRMSGDGVLILGDAAGFVNVPALKGIHYAMMSGIYAARTIFKALKNNDVSQKSLESYDETIKSSFIYKELYKVRNMRLAFKDGFFKGGIKSALMLATQGLFPGDPANELEDAAEPKTFSEPQSKTGLSKVDAVYLSGNKTRDDIPSHLTVGQDVSAEVAEFYSHLCPAGVYEKVDGKLQVNAPNCVDCKATDVLGPRWEPREGGSGPNYKLM